MLLRELTRADEPEFWRALDGAAQAPNFAREYVRGMAYADYLETLAQLRSFLFFGFVGGKIVARLSLRPQLNELELRITGQIGYVVLPAHRRRGYGSEILRLGLQRARALGLRRVLITCDEDNVYSRRIIEKNGGVYENSYDAPELRVPKRRYWISCDSAD